MRDTINDIKQKAQEFVKVKARRSDKIKDDESIYDDLDEFDNADDFEVFDDEVEETQETADSAEYDENYTDPEDEYIEDAVSEFNKLYERYAELKDKSADALKYLSSVKTRLEDERKAAAEKRAADEEALKKARAESKRTQISRAAASAAARAADTAEEVSAKLTTSKKQLESVVRTLTELEERFDSAETQIEASVSGIVSLGNAVLELDAKTEEIKSAVDALADKDNGTEAVANGIAALDAHIDTLESDNKSAMESLTADVNAVGERTETQLSEMMTELAEIKAAQEKIGDTVESIYSSTASLDKLTDNVFSLKKTQVDINNSLEAVNTSVKKVKGLLTAAFITLAVLGAAAVVLEVIQLIF